MMSQNTVSGRLMKTINDIIADTPWTCRKDRKSGHFIFRIDIPECSEREAKTIILEVESANDFGSFVENLSNEIIRKYDLSVIENNTFDMYGRWHANSNVERLLDMFQEYQDTHQLPHLFSDWVFYQDRD